MAALENEWAALYCSPKEIWKAERRTREWTIPVLQSLGINPPDKVLSVGCGNGADVRTMRAAGYDASGVDLFIESEHVLRCDARDVPLADSSFDAVISLEVIEHVGVLGGSKPAEGSAFVVDSALHQDRQLYASELRRLLRGGGILILGTPNRYFPLDEHGDPVRFHSPLRDWTLTYRELSELFPRMSVGILPWGKYFAFERWEGLLGKLPTRLAALFLPIFNLKLLHMSPLNPHLFVWFRKAGKGD